MINLLWRLVSFGTIIALLAFPLYADEPSVVHVQPNSVSAWLQQKSVPNNERIEIRLNNGTTLKGALRDYGSERMLVYIETIRPKNAMPLGETQIDDTSISKFRLRIGAANRGLAILGGTVGFFVGCIPGAAIAANDYGTKTTEKVVGPIIMVVGGVGGAWLGSKFGARKKITVEVAP